MHIFILRGKTVAALWVPQPASLVSRLLPLVPARFRVRAGAGCAAGGSHVCGVRKHTRTRCRICEVFRTAVTRLKADAVRYILFSSSLPQFVLCASCGQKLRGRPRSFFSSVKGKGRARWVYPYSCPATAQVRPGSAVEDRRLFSQRFMAARPAEQCLARRRYTVWRGPAVLFVVSGCGAA